ncbi:TetR/AcrR family transcriptional regulator [Demequina capsici]|uniref:Helix-turn-helix domain-containing protein n=1 Tax=Demequina capsici TaxID=3075620 RepID=A0AA96JCM1_9MICO|nr:helix-turn-helix domain-containing protein [Demequina sp. OYTSA14]WNM23774.1 helix-turn-helix domain-containing protein [Demequina sp. OYTSA14]
MAGQRGEYAKSARRREEILDAAFTVFSRSGFTGATVSEIAREVGMSQPGLLHHFDSKLAMLEAVFERRDQSALDILSGRRDIEFLRGLVEISRRNHEKRDLIRLYTVIAAEATAPDHPAHAHFQRRFHRVLGGTQAAFEEAQRLGLLKEGVDPRAAALSSIAVTEGLQLMWLSGFDEIDMAKGAQIHMQQFLTVPL